MPDSSYFANSLESLEIKSKKIDCGRVKIGVNNERPLEIQNDEGKVVFFVDNLGANVHTLNSTTSFLELIDTPNDLGNDDSILGIEAGKMKFIRDVKLSKAEVNCLAATSIGTETIKSDGIISNSIISGTLIVDDITAPIAKMKNITSDNIVCDNMTIDNFTTSNIRGDDLKFTNAELINLKSNSLVSTKISSSCIDCNSLKNRSAEIDHLLSETLTGKEIKCDELESNIIRANEITTEACNSTIVMCKEVNADKLILKKNTYGSNEEPLNLAITQVKSVDVTGDVICIISKIPCGVNSQQITVNGLVDADYAVNLTLNQVNDCTHTFIRNEGCHLLRIKYGERVGRDTQVKILIQKI
tara:strand:- start:202 stop:1275 length:1074 start_codon:yes stop_codon:yes gene_type:complete